MKRLGFAFLGLLACGEVRVTPSNPGTDDAGTDDAGTTPGPLLPGASNQLLGDPILDLDILFVIDNSQSMEDKQRELSTELPALLNSLRRGVESPLDLHIGVTSTDVGAGDFNITACNNEGDNGILQINTNAGCSLNSDRYIAQNGMSANFSGQIEDVFSCISNLGVSGCGFEQPLEAMLRALDGTNPSNDGFMRPEAMLAVVLLTDEDDCSTANEEMFDTDFALDNPDSILGSLSSFRCFEFGVVCDPDNPRTTGAKIDCRSREDSEYMHPVGEYEEFLGGLKDSGGKVVFTAIAGVGNVSVGPVPDTMGTRLNSVCGMGAAEGAVPAVRIAELSKRMGMPPVSNICNAVGNSMNGIGSVVNTMMSGSCLTRPNGNCRILDIENFGQSDEKVVSELPDCDTSTTDSCFRLEPNIAQCGAGGMQVIVERRGSSIPAANTSTVASCSDPL